MITKVMLRVLDYSQYLDSGVIYRSQVIKLISVIMELKILAERKCQVVP